MSQECCCICKACVGQWVNAWGWSKSTSWVWAFQCGLQCFCWMLGYGHQLHCGADPRILKSRANVLINCKFCIINVTGDHFPFIVTRSISESAWNSTCEDLKRALDGWLFTGIDSSATRQHCDWKTWWCWPRITAKYYNEYFYWSVIKQRDAQACGPIAQGTTSVTYRGKRKQTGKPAALHPYDRISHSVTWQIEHQLLWYIDG